ncbi:hypothetical protein KXR53_15930 [Inquilinus limosus]|uniref:hypothetical protein n=1 Tax=Inquilinus limosus TaxID=171674 RepID=UPI003F190C8B
MVIISTSALDVSIQAVSPELIAGAAAASCAQAGAAASKEAATPPNPQNVRFIEFSPASSSRLTVGSRPVGTGTNRPSSAVQASAVPILPARAVPSAAAGRSRAIDEIMSDWHGTD